MKIKRLAVSFVLLFFLAGTTAIQINSQESPDVPEECATQLAEYRLQIADISLEEIQMRFIVQKIEGDYRELTGARQAIAQSISTASKALDVATYLNYGAGLISLSRFLSAGSFLGGKAVAVSQASSSIFAKAGSLIAALSRIGGVQVAQRHYKPKAEEALKELDEAISHLNDYRTRIKNEHNNLKQSKDELEKRMAESLRKCKEQIEQEKSGVEEKAADEIDPNLISVQYSAKMTGLDNNKVQNHETIMVTNNNKNVTLVIYDITGETWINGKLAAKDFKAAGVVNKTVPPNIKVLVLENKAAWSKGNNNHKVIFVLHTNAGKLKTNSQSWTAGQWLGTLPW